MADSRTQIVINLDVRDALGFDRTAQSLGFGSRNAYVVFLHRALQTAVQLTGPERHALRHLGDWGFQNFRNGTPTVQELARHCFTDEGALRKTLDSLKRLGLLAEAEPIEGPYRGDVRLSETRRLEITKAGLAATRAISFLEQQEAHTMVSERLAPSRLARVRR